jgi:hypothetical protein
VESPHARRSPASAEAPAMTKVKRLLMYVSCDSKGERGDPDVAVVRTLCAACRGLDRHIIKIS